MPARTRTPADTAPAPEPARETDPGGYFRNDAATALTVLGDGPAAILAPGRIAPMKRTPTHRDLTVVSAADFQAQESADRAAETAPADASVATSTSETEA